MTEIERKIEELCERQNILIRLQNRYVEQSLDEKDVNAALRYERNADKAEILTNIVSSTRFILQEIKLMQNHIKALTEFCQEKVVKNEDNNRNR